MWLIVDGWWAACFDAGSWVLNGVVFGLDVLGWLVCLRVDSCYGGGAFARLVVTFVEAGGLLVVCFVGWVVLWFV